MGGHVRLLVDGEPFLILGGELHNSSTGGRQTIRSSFESLAGRHLNTVLAAVTWETVEPAEGHFDFSLVDELLDAAREGGFKLVPLWFGAWKNASSSYAPQWVTSDVDRFPRAVLGSGRPSGQVSPFGRGIRDADSAAFAAFMAHLRDVDAEARTVVMVQVENEVGLLGDSRDRSREASQAFEADVPPEVFDALVAAPSDRLSRAWHERGNARQGSWTSAFGSSPATDEAFMAVAYASHLEAVASAGKAAYPLPMFTNAWLDSDGDTDPLLAGGQHPGEYPSGGPLPQVAGLWRAFAPSLDFCAPDIYFGDFGDTCQRFRAASGPLFIPEMRRDERGAGDVFIAIGNHAALGTSPFGVDSTQGAEQDAMREAYGLLDSVAPLVPQHGTAGLHLDGSVPTAEVVLEDYVLHVSLEMPIGATGPVDRGYGLVVQLEHDSFVIVGRGLEIAFRCADGRHAEVLSVDEVAGRAPDLVSLRRLNGDETLSGTRVVLHTGALPEPTDFPIPRDRRPVRMVRCQVQPAPSSAWPPDGQP